MTYKNYNRRTLLKSSALGTLAIGSAGLIGTTIFTTDKSFAKTLKPMPLKIPTAEYGSDKDGTQVYNLTLQNGTTEFFEGQKTKTSGINTSYLGPTLIMQKGQKVRFNVTNNLGEVSTLHWHGMHLPASQDGGPHQLIKHGETWSPEFTVNQQAASLWYHPHLKNKTAEHVWRGMAGMLIIEDEEVNELGLPQNYGLDDIPLILQDRTFDQNGNMDYDPSMHSVMMGMIGNVPLANGTTSAYFDAKTNLLRLRILNASNASFYNLGFNTNKPFWQIGSDGGLLENSVKLSRLLLAPGERAEIIVRLEERKTITLRNFAWNPQGNGGGNSGMMGNISSTPEFNFLEIRTNNSLIDLGKVPSSLINMDKLNEADATVNRTFVLQMNMGPRVMLGLVNSHLINNKSMKMSHIDEFVKVGTTEIWEIRNDSIMAHPFHIHDVQFQILDRDGNSPKNGERGRKDVVLVNPGETVRLIMKFEDYSDPEIPFMYHCHILEHEDAGMMGQFVVV